MNTMKEYGVGIYIEYIVTAESKDDAIKQAYNLFHRDTRLDGDGDIMTYMPSEDDE